MLEMRMTLQRRFAVCVAVLCFAVALSAQTQEWKSYSYPADGFRALFPDEPTQQKKDIATDAGNVELRAYVASVSSTTTVFIGVCDYGDKVANKTPDAVLEGAKEGAMANTKSHLLREKSIGLDGNHGIEFECENDEMHFFARVYLVGSTLYQTLVVYPLADKYADTARFLDSFKLITRVRN